MSKTALDRAIETQADLLEELAMRMDMFKNMVIVPDVASFAPNSKEKALSRIRADAHDLLDSAFDNLKRIGTLAQDAAKDDDKG